MVFVNIVFFVIKYSANLTFHEGNHNDVGGAKMISEQVGLAPQLVLDLAKGFLVDFYDLLLLVPVFAVVGQ